MRTFQANLVSSKRENNFFLFVSLLILSIVLIGFGPQYFLKAPIQPSSIPFHIHIHSLVFTGWIILFIVQVRLIGILKHGTHKKLGYFSTALAVLMIFFGILTAIKGAENGHNPGGPFKDGFGFMIVSIVDILIFSLFFILGYIFRNKSDYHKRWMLLATIGGLLFAPISRLPFIAGQAQILMAVFVLFVLLPPIYDKLIYKKIHPANIWGPLIIIISLPLRTFIGMTETWHKVAVWAVGLV